MSQPQRQYLNPNLSKARYWLLTIPQHGYTPYLPRSVRYIRGQLECGAESGYLHWQLLVTFAQQQRLAAVKKLFGDACHAEPSRSSAATSYVWKDDTRIEGTQFELGEPAFHSNDGEDWTRVRSLAKRGELDDIPAGVFVKHYRTLRAIAADYAEPTGIERTIRCFWGPTGTGKSRRAWEEAGVGAYPKDPLTKFWCGYRNQSNVVIDEFRGGIGISHMLRWMDRYPVLVELKGSATVLVAQRIWITSNLHPRDWYPDLDETTVEALLRRMEIIHIPM